MDPEQEASTPMDPEQEAIIVQMEPLMFRLPDLSLAEKLHLIALEDKLDRLMSPIWYGPDAPRPRPE
jgi:hypothetical protein